MAELAKLNPKAQFEDSVEVLNSVNSQRESVISNYRFDKTIAINSQSSEILLSLSFESLCRLFERLVLFVELVLFSIAVR